MSRHYASGRFVQGTILLAGAAGASAYLWLPEALEPAAATIARNAWILLGTVGAFCIQLLLQLITVGEDKALSARQQSAVMKIVDERMRYLWDLTGVAVLALMVCLSADSIADAAIRRVLLGFSWGLIVWTALLAARLPSLFIEIRNFRWRLARERNQIEARNAVLAALKEAAEDPVPNVPEPERPDHPTH